MAGGDNTREGYLLIDNRVAQPMPGIPHYMEAAAILCSHCQRGIIRNPVRERSRAHCFGCHKDVCDDCAIAMRIHGCKPFDVVIEEYLRSVINVKEV